MMFIEEDEELNMLLTSKEITKVKEFFSDKGLDS